MARWFGRVRGSRWYKMVYMIVKSCAHTLYIVWYISLYCSTIVLASAWSNLVRSRPPTAHPSQAMQGAGLQVWVPGSEERGLVENDFLSPIRGRSWFALRYSVGFGRAKISFCSSDDEAGGA